MRGGWLGLAAILALGGCQTIPKSAAETCPAKNFPAFFERFADDEAVQRQYTQLAIGWVDVLTGSDTGIMMEGVLTASRGPDQPAGSRYGRFKFPVVPAPRLRADSKLGFQFFDVEGEHPSVEMWKQGDKEGYEFKYEFTKNDCWLLTRVHRREFATIDPAP